MNLHAIYLLARVKDNQSSVLDAGAELTTKRAAPIVLLGSEATHLYPGFSPWKQLLIEHGVAAERIVGTAPILPLNTRTEALALVREAKKNGWKRVLIVSTAWHQVRAFFTNRSSAQTGMSGIERIQSGR